MVLLWLVYFHRHLALTGRHGGGLVGGAPLQVPGMLSGNIGFSYGLLL
jgi:hypothetical protein